MVGRRRDREGDKAVTRGVRRDVMRPTVRGRAMMGYKSGMGGTYDQREYLEAHNAEGAPSRCICRCHLFA